MIARTPLLRRILRLTTWADTDCWLWQGSRTANGYGRIGSGGRAENGGRTVLVHRAVYELLTGPVPNGLDLDHLCRVRHCCNPSHLEPVDRSTNLQRGNGPLVTQERCAAITTCARGHAYDPDNTYRHNNKRACRACHRDAQRRYLARRS